MALILHVDDDRLIRRFVRLRLEKAGYRVEEAENGAEGLERIGELDPDLVLMDIDMPILDGYEAIQSLRADGYEGLIAALTGGDRVGDLYNALLAGCDDFIPKPIDESFEQRVSAALRKDRAAALRSFDDEDLWDEPARPASPE